MLRTITPLENFKRMMAGDQPYWLPLALSMTPPVLDELQRHTGTRSPREAFDLDFENIGCDVTSTRHLWRDALIGIGWTPPDDAEYDSDGVVHIPPPAQSVGSAYHLRTMLHPLEGITEARQLEALPWPDVFADRAYAGVAERVQSAHERGLVAHAGLECTVFERAWYVRGMDNLYCDLVEGSDIANWLLDWHMKRSAHQAGRYAAAGVDVIGLGDDIGTQRGMMMAPDFWREHLKPRLKHVVDSIRAHQTRHVWVKYHSDGDVRDVLEDLVEIGIDILNPVQPECMPHDQVIPQWRSRVAFWGLIGTQTTMPFGSPEDVREAVSRIAEHVHEGARIVISPTHVLEPDVPWCNIQALVDAVRSVRLDAPPRSAG